MYAVVCVHCVVELVRFARCFCSGNSNGEKTKYFKYKTEADTTLIDPPIKRRSTTTRKLCPHCGKHVLKKTYIRHRRLYYDPSTDSWKEHAVPRSKTGLL